MQPNWQLIGVLVIFDIYNPGQKSLGHSGGSRGPKLGPKKFFQKNRPPQPYLRVWITTPPPPLISHVWIRHWDSTVIFIFLSFLGSLLKQCIFFEIFLQFFLLPPYAKLKLGKILDTRVQHCLWGEGRGWTCVNWKMPQKCKSVPRLLSMIEGM